MIKYTTPLAVAITDNARFDKKIYRFLKKWVRESHNETLLRFDQSLEAYLADGALRDFFLSRPNALQELLQMSSILKHLSRPAKRVYFEPSSGDPILATTEQRIYNLARRICVEGTHIPFRSVQPNKQTEAGDNAAINTYPEDSEQIRYNSGNHFASRPANNNVFQENSRSVSKIAAEHLHVYFQEGFLEDRLHDAITLSKAMQLAGRMEELYFVICSRHSQKEGHFGVSLLIMDPSNPYFPERVIVCDTLLKELPQHPRWWPHFVEEFTNVFGPAVIELIEDASHPLQKVNIKGDNPYNHDWDCPYYATMMAKALAQLVVADNKLLRSGTLQDIHLSMARRMPEYYQQDDRIRDRQEIRHANQLKR
ncbi:hypothetical protein [Mucilaginibacter conchicola]|uniref:hypothetical protein n=1 Tax=Mucilaginibacter conchicola TaxID=2303333 RepID=UPI001F47EA3A|nr:hypothetical protein [Mucilaginibacter conchicola]